MKKKWFEFKKIYMNQKKSCLTILLILIVLVFLCMTLKLIQGQFSSAILCISSILFFFLPILIQIKFSIKISNPLEILIYLFLFASQILGEVYHFYVLVPSWDLILHTLSGFLCVGIGISIISFFTNSGVHLSIWNIIIFGFCFSMTTSVCWEFGEYTIDKIFLTDAQKDIFVKKISSVKLDESKNNKPVKIYNIEKTILFDKDGQAITTIYGGYLDIGLNDTMKDLIANFIGAIIYSIFGYFYIKYRDKNDLTRNFIFTQLNN